ncbi:pantoate-beta-alanine ligase [Vermiconidia calcicola]|uniref:Pantoate-beta-alanine ligase n=1 Tax=Vermiconidia calcicola TaxID=1690605 RepID=A0ACC3ND97_9PEZI|nr:pantoate-beta-alanine ligase [Vermiconidia calcicola]
MASKRIAQLDVLSSATALSTRAKILLSPCLSHSTPHSRTFHVFREVAPLRKHRRELLLKGETVGLVPTMGALHAGHLSLARQAAAENSRVFVSIYVNPTQFGVNEDLDSYPKTWDADTHMLGDLDKELAMDGKGRIEAVFAPTSKVMYPTLPPDSTLPGKGSFVTITPLGDVLEGRTRPVFMRGVATVCTKLFNIVEAEQVYFGQKDVQQTVVIKRMVQDFHINTKVRIVPTEREPDGLAMSSRNGYLGERRRKIGVVLSQALRAAEAAYRMGKRGRDDILALAWHVTNRMGMEQDALSETERARFEVDYISLADPETLDELEEVDASKGAILSGAIKMLPLEATRDGEKLGRGNDEVPVRLIDNIILGPQK